MITLDLAGSDMTDSGVLAKALADVRQRRSELQAEHERIAAELGKLRVAEASLAALVDGTPLGEAGELLDDLAGASLGDGQPRAARTGRRGPRGPRANSAKGRLRALLDEAGPQGLTQAEITRRLPDVSPATLNAYLSGMVSGGEAVRAGDFFRSGGAAAEDGDDAEPEAAETDAPDEEAAA